jgi:purine-nucleoside phosphorylase
MSVHIAAQKGEIASVVLMPGDPLRAKYIADHFLEEVTLVSGTRNIYFYTGLYKGKKISVGASGMGVPSIGIYSYELYTEFDVETIIRIGTCGAYTTDLKVYDLLNVEQSFSESTYAQHAWGIEGEGILHQGATYEKINQTAALLEMDIKKVNIHTSDIFYRKDLATPAIAKNNACPAVEMEAFALFANAQYLNKNAATLLTVSDIIPTGENISAEHRETALKKMMTLALETAISE